MKLIKFALAVPLLGLLASPVLARGDGDFDRLERRHDRQHTRIERGVKGGSLTRKEAKKLRKGQRHIHKLERKFRRDGHLDRHERRTLRHEYDHAHRNIYRYKHNDRYRHKHNDHRRDHRYTKRYRHDHGHRDRSHRRYDDSGWILSLGLWDRW